MATPPKPDPLSKRREQDVNDDFYEEPICPCEEGEPPSQSEYDVPGEWVTYTGDIDMSIFDRAAWTAKDDLEREIRAYARNEQLGLRSALSSSSEGSTDRNTPATNLITDHSFAPSAPSLDELSLDDQESELEIIREEISRSAEAAASYEPHSYWCDNRHRRFPQASGSRLMTRIAIVEIPKMPESDEEDAIAGVEAPIDEVPKQEAPKFEADVGKADAPIAEATECPALIEKAEIAEAEIIGAAEIMAEASDDEAENQAVVVAIPSDQVEAQD